MGETAVGVANPDKPEALRLAELAERVLRRYGMDVTLSTNQDDDLSTLRPALAVVFGGDGTVLGAVANLGPEQPPIVAFNVGRLGYIAANPPDRVEEIIDLALGGKLQVSRRMMVDARVATAEGEWRGCALNEFAITSRRHSRLLPITVRVDGEDLMDIRADGLIVATATGSTAYALAAGGPVASPELAALILAPICPHQLANRSLVLDPAEKVEICHHGEDPVELVADGRHRRMIEADEVLEITRSRTRVRLLAPQHGKYETLREKLGWGWKAGG